MLFRSRAAGRALLLQHPRPCGIHALQELRHRFAAFRGVFHHEGVEAQRVVRAAAQGTEVALLQQRRDLHRAPAGAGHGLVNAIVETARGWGCAQVHLTVVAGNGPAERLYRRTGFEAYGVDPRALYVDGRFLDELLMVRFL